MKSLILLVFLYTFTSSAITLPSIKGRSCQSLLEHKINEPFSHLETETQRTLQPLTFREYKDFTFFEQKIISKLIKLSRNFMQIWRAKKHFLSMNPNHFQSRRELNEYFKDGIEYGQWILTLKDGSILTSKPFTGYRPDTLSGLFSLNLAIENLKIDKNQMSKIQIFHTHPGEDSSHCLLSSTDIDVANELHEEFSNSINQLEVHIFAIDLSTNGKFVCHYSANP